MRRMAVGLAVFVLALPAAPADARPYGGITVTHEPLTVALGGTWVTPKAGARITTWSTVLSVRPTASGPGVTTFTRVVFWATWAGTGKRTVCTATRPGPEGDWSCRANLLGRGVPPGIVSLTFDVHGVGIGVARSPAGARRIMFAVPPPRPTHVKVRIVSDVTTGDSRTIVKRLTWTEPDGYATGFRWIGVTSCPNATRATEVAGEPCLLPGTALAGDVLETIANAPGTARSMTWTVVIHPLPPLGWTTVSGSPYFATVLGASNRFGLSTLAIVEAAVVPCRWTCTY